MTVIRTYASGQESASTLVNCGEVLVFLGHTEFGWGEDPEGVEVIFYTFEDEYVGERTNVPRQDPMHHMHELPEEVWKPFEEDFGEWGTFAVIKGPLYRLQGMFVQWAGSLMVSLDPSGYLPGGDDTYFDYWPSGMEGLRGFAKDLDAIHEADTVLYEGDSFLGVYDTVLLDFLVNEKLRNKDDWLWEHIPDLIAELAGDYSMTKAECTDYICALAQVKARRKDVHAT